MSVPLNNSLKGLGKLGLSTLLSEALRGDITPPIQTNVEHTLLPL
ncbi:hypothetical protein QWZ13_13980 [Reinekea marina]|nr:hypothetical protein [Reinekea marina]MDN3650025.1 hypothetical protein [Reinekea marina]